MLEWARDADVPVNTDDTETEDGGGATEYVKSRPYTAEHLQNKPCSVYKEGYIISIG